MAAVGTFLGQEGGGGLSVGSREVEIPPEANNNSVIRFRNGTQLLWSRVRGVVGGRHVAETSNAVRVILRMRRLFDVVENSRWTCRSELGIVAE
jgi:hypothetical protein